jgi:hypothetical protein
MDGMTGAQKYLENLSKGMAPAEAYRDAFPDGPPKAKTPKEIAGEQQKGSMAGLGGLVGGAVAAKYGMEALPGLFAAAPAAEVAPIAAELGGILPALQAPMSFGGAQTALGGFGVGGGAGGGASAAATGSAGAMGTQAAALSPYLGMAGVIGPPLAAALIANYVMGDNPDRPYVASEAADSRLLSKQIAGFGDKSAEERANVANKLHDLGMLGATGKGTKDESGNMVSADPTKPWFAMVGPRRGINNMAYTFDEQMANYLYGPGSIRSRMGENLDRAKQAIGAVYGDDKVDERLSLIQALAPSVQEKRKNKFGSFDRD